MLLPVASSVTLRSPRSLHVFLHSCRKMLSFAIRRHTLGGRRTLQNRAFDLCPTFIDNVPFMLGFCTLFASSFLIIFSLFEWRHLNALSHVEADYVRWLTASIQNALARTRALRCRETHLLLKIDVSAFFIMYRNSNNPNA